MAFPQLSGRMAGGAGGRSSTNGVVMSVLGLALLLALVAWRFLPEGAAVHQETSGAVQLAMPESRTIDTVVNRQLRLAHTEQQLVAAQEQLMMARRLLSTLSQELRRNYLQSEKRRADGAWTACDQAQRFIEQSLDDIKSIAVGKD